MRLLAAAIPVCTLMAQTPDLDRKLWVQNLLVKLEKQRYEVLVQVKAAEERVARNQDLVSRTAAGTHEAQATARQALAASRTALDKRRLQQVKAEGAVVRVQQALQLLGTGTAPIRALPLAIQGEAFVVTKDGSHHALGMDRPWLEPGDRLVTGPTGRVELEAFDGQATLVVGPETRLTIPQGDEPSLQSEYGKFIGKWKARADRKFTVRTQTIVLAVRGTRFLVEARPQGNVTCLVLEGTVDVSDREGKVSRPVTAGQRLRIPSTHVPGQPLPEPEAVDIKTLDRWWDREEAP
ncbi:MAG: FecR domain-containing protein [Holophaga sp.]|nr:FecR domain-containing protein [Holophaga sp.]